MVSTSRLMVRVRLRVSDKVWVCGSFGFAVVPCGPISVVYLADD